MNREEIYPANQQASYSDLENCASDQQPKSILEVKWAYRWEVYRRLKALDINCQCSTNEPLLVHLDSPRTIMQIWSVLRQANASRQELINKLEDCWRLK